MYDSRVFEKLDLQFFIFKHFEVIEIIDAQVIILCFLEIETHHVVVTSVVNNMIQLGQSCNNLRIVVLKNFSRVQIEPHFMNFLILKLRFRKPFSFILYLAKHHNIFGFLAIL